MEPTHPNIGVFGNEDGALEMAVERMVEALDPQSIWLFGSRARGDHRADSDYDLMVVAKPDGQFDSGDCVKALRPTFGTGLDCEVVPCSWPDFEEARTLTTTLVAQVLEQGKLLYEAKP
jgi:uncharacterized protein